MLNTSASACTVAALQSDKVLTYQALVDAWRNLTKIDQPWEEAFNKEFALPHGFDMNDEKVHIFTGCAALKASTPPRWRNRVLYSQSLGQRDVVLCRGGDLNSFNAYSSIGYVPLT